jgi:tripartite-type tricarboxylate transporter receptor subunit TctC
MERFATRWGARHVLAAMTVALSMSAIVGSGHVHAQTYPNRPVRIVVPAAAGGALDLFSRILAQKVSEIWKQQVYVENKPGANWIIGMDTVARSAPDGYTLLFVASSGVTVNPYVFPKMPVDPMRDFTPVTMPTTTPFVLLANPKLPVKSIAEFIAYLRKNPGKLNHASNSATTMLVSELFKAQAKVAYTDVNYRGASQAINDTIGGATQFCFVDLGSGSIPIDAKTLNPLALTGPKRDPQHPDIPTLTEHALPGFLATASTLLLAPAKTPPDVLARLNTVFQKALDTPEVRAKFKKMGQVVVGGNAREIDTSLRAEAKQWKSLIEERHIRFDR